jgi:hypothetical protein
MATAHGAGLMVLPIVLGAATPGTMHHHVMSMAMAPIAAGAAGVNPLAITAALIHTAGYLAATIGIAFVVYEKLGLRILRRAWINVDALWSGALIVAAVVAAVGR